MKIALTEINALRQASIIGESAIGGAIGATFYLEPISTFDLDIFVLFDHPPLILRAACLLQPDQPHLMQPPTSLLYPLRSRAASQQQAQ